VRLAQFLDLQCLKQNLKAHYTISRVTTLNLTTSPHYGLHSGNGKTPPQTVHFTSSYSLHSTHKNCTHKLTWKSFLSRTDAVYVLTTNRKDRILESKQSQTTFDLQPSSERIQPLRCSRTRRHPQLANPLRKRSHLLYSWFTSVLSILTTHTGKL